jgi:hypothetical protein
MASRTKPTRVKITGDLYHPVVPDGAVRITRPGRWGNPHKVGPGCPPTLPPPASVPTCSPVV